MARITITPQEARSMYEIELMQTIRKEDATPLSDRETGELKTRDGKPLYAVPVSVYDLERERPDRNVSIKVEEPFTLPRRALVALDGNITVVPWVNSTGRIALSITATRIIAMSQPEKQDAK